MEPDLTESADRTRRRREETAHDVLERRLEKILTHPEHGIATQLAALADAFQHVRNPERVMQWLNTPRGGPVLLRELAIRAHTEPVTHDLLDRYPQTYTLHRLRDLFVYAGILPARIELLERIQPWLDRMLSQRPQHHATLVRPFATWHVMRRARQRARRRPTTASSATYARASVISYKLRAHGIDTLPSRNAARAGWARDIPSPIAADLLGINISTATQWARRTRRDWTDYLAERAQAQERDDRICPE